MKKITYLIASIAVFLRCGGVFADVPVFDLIPLWGITVKAEKLQYSNIKVETEDASSVLNNNIPQNLQFTVSVLKPEGFADSAGWSNYGLELVLKGATGVVISTVNDLVAGTAPVKKGEFATISYSLKFDGSTKPGSKIEIAARIFDKYGKGSISYIYTITVVSASKRLPDKILTYNSSDSRGMKATSVGLHFNFFEFKGVEGNQFLYKIHNNDEIQFALKGLQGWKIKEGKASPVAEFLLMDDEGKIVETEKNVISEMHGTTIPADKKELKIKYQPKSPLHTGKFYFVWLKLRDANSTKSALDVVIKVYVE